MGYGDSDADMERAHKTGRIAIISMLMVALGLFLFLYKTESCSAKPENCKEEFIEFDSANKYSNNHACAPGAVVQMVVPSSGGKAGIMCHCVSNMKTDAGQ